jgi:hypothetical protein
MHSDDLEAGRKLNEHPEVTRQTSVSRAIGKRLSTPLKLALLIIILLTSILPLFTKLPNANDLNESSTSLKDATKVLLGAIESRDTWAPNNVTSLRN